MQRVDRVQIARRGAGGGQRRGDLPRDEAGLAHPGDDHPATAALEEVDRPREVLVEPVRRGTDAPCLEAKDPAAQLDQRGAITRHGEPAP